MSTRVEKGNTRFRPIIKPKTRPSATPAPQDARDRQSIDPAISMPPPSTIPERSDDSGSSTAALPTPTPSEYSSTLAIAEPGHLRGVPISLSRSTATKRPTPKEKNRAQPEPVTPTTTPTTDSANPAERVPVAQKRPKAAILQAEADETGDNAEVSDAARPRKKQRRRAATVESTEPVGTPEPIDPTQTTMKAICDDLGSGRMSSRWESSQLLYVEARKRAREDRARAIAEAEELERETGRVTGKRSASKIVLPGDKSNTEGDEETVENAGQNPDEFNYTESLKASHYAPQVRIGANGEVVLDMDSLQVDRAADPEFVEEYSHIEETDQGRYTNSNSWSKRRIVRWGKEDTALFYDALRQFGQNFDLISRILPGRTYRMCKNKFKAEDKKNPALIDEALKNGVAVDLSTLSRMTGRDFTGPTPIIEAPKVVTFAEDGAPPQNPQENISITEENVSVSQLDNSDSVVVTTGE